MEVFEVLWDSLDRTTAFPVSPCFRALPEDFWIPAGDFVPAAFAPFRRACFRSCLEDICRYSCVESSCGAYGGAENFGLSCCGRGEDSFHFFGNGGGVGWGVWQ